MTADQGAANAVLLEKMSAEIAANTVAIETLQGRADDAQHRATAGEAAIADDRDRIDGLEERVDLDGIMIAELQAEGLLSTQHAADLEVALRSSRRIGAAIGVIMGSCNVSEDNALRILRKASMDGNRKLRALAEEIVLTGHLTGIGFGQAQDRSG